MVLEEIRRLKREKILSLASRHGASNIRVFGSVARGEASSSSDLDLLVELEPGRSLMDLGGFLMDVQRELGMRIDVATERMLRPEVRSRALAEATPL
ncbi:MAG: nucleotidyltransferase family protein [Acidobacteriaceae bacterium]|nr:nucleotidyltransferase family protein [Acidobacteriaceae bacterium]MBV9226711.1 nucleotidyltransferase family protein [Acidobacteriaceae bacterium]